MKKNLFLILLTFFIGKLSAQDFTMEQVTAYPFPSELTTCSGSDKMAWALNEQGKRNIYVAEGPDFEPRKLTHYDQDEGQEISSLQISADGNWVVYVRGGEHGGGNAHVYVNPTSLPVPPKVEIWKVPFSGGKPILIGEGDQPTLSSDSKKLAFIHGGQAWMANLENEEPAKKLFTSKGSTGSLEWSPDGKRLVFVSSRGDHAFVGVYTDEKTSIKWLAPAFARDRSPRWSPDGEKVVFVRTPGGGGEPDSLLVQQHRPWSIWTADVESGEAEQIWKAPETLEGSVPTTHGGFNLHWAVDRIVFLSYKDGWPHLYSIPEVGGVVTQLTKGDFMLEHITLSKDGKRAVFSANTGSTPEDLDRRHIGMVSLDEADMELLTDGEGIEAYPFFIGESDRIAMFSGDFRQPLLPSVMDIESKEIKVLSLDRLVEDFPLDHFVEPKQVSFEAADGVKVYGQLFEKEGGDSQKPAVVFVHGGPQRQMLLGWSYMDYYSNTYALNQYLANQGFVVLSVNFRMGIGYGHDFHKPEGAGIAGASEYQDVKAAGEYLAQLEQVDSNKIGVYGGSYGGYLTAIALGLDSDLFAVGVDIHGVHNRDGYIKIPDGIEQAPDLEKARQVAWDSSPVAMLDNWTSPVLLIHAGDDRNVNISHSVDLARRLEQRNIPYEYLVIPDDTHHWMVYANMVKVNQATADFLKKHLMK
ncbi:S9 family peptidase [Litoribacter ruber]|uniref:S9 family peptidase n=1 Tax=Litoribacter ruber TaxID=702568 RepID=UPI001BDB3474|nr:prolyl oligopeptidase family serine peptidase [Litoribacter ruber]MBT0812668.1 S9 family peptidase [Litoribacter ruber]